MRRPTAAAAAPPAGRPENGYTLIETALALLGVALVILAALAAEAVYVRIVS